MRVWSTLDSMRVQQNPAGSRSIKLWVESNTKQVTVDGPTEIPDADAKRYIGLRLVTEVKPAKKTTAKKTAAKKVSGG